MSVLESCGLFAAVQPVRCGREAHRNTLERGTNPAGRVFTRSPDAADRRVVTVTIKDVANRAGVSPKTVSRVMNGEHHVKPAKQDAVLRAVEELGYRPNAFARSLSSARSYLIGLFFDDPASGYASQMQRGALNACRTHSYHLLVDPVDLGADDWIMAIVATASSLRLDGVILPPPLSQSPTLIDALEELSIPYVLVSPGPVTTSPAGIVDIDERGAAADMTRHLVGLGHRLIGFVEGDPHHASAALRLSGFTQAMEEAGLLVDRSLVMDGDFSFRSGLDAGERMLGRDDRPTAVFASNDDMALGVSIAALKAGIAVPAELSIAGFDDAATSRLGWPPITTVRQPVMEMGAAAVALLVDAGQKSSDRSVREFNRRLDYEIVVRASTAPIP